MLTKSDLKSIKDLMNDSNQEIVSALTKLVTRTAGTLRNELASKEDVERIKHLPTKDEFFERMDKLMGEVKSMRESQEIHVGTHTEITGRLEKLEKAFKIS